MHSSAESSHNDGVNTAQRVPLEIAFSVVAEYIPEAFHEEAARAVGIVVSAIGNSNSPAKGFEAHSASSSPSSKKTSKSARGPVSASVRKLEKAGRPKGTPTLFSILGKK
ncbi:unnamed protein product [Phytomonas sp. Hart1]|nr:unnamed protein product [Phytomonas sp. Hart1]|eukprot:CCW70268.1 unnamed protein product [Phytomonas sp. isolate Hart1]